MSLFVEKKVTYGKYDFFKFSMILSSASSGASLECLFQSREGIFDDSNLNEKF